MPSIPEVLGSIPGTASKQANNKEKPTSALGQLKRESQAKRWGMVG